MKNTTCYMVKEEGFSKKEGEFETIFGAYENLNEAIKKWAEQKCKLFDEKDFYLKKEFEDGDFVEHNLISSKEEEMPCLTIEIDEEYYELYVCEIEGFI